MRVFPIATTLAAVLIVPLGSARAAAPDLGRWFYAATSIDATTVATATSRPDFMGGKTRSSMPCGVSGHAIGNGIWVLVKYDRTHHIGLAAASTDQCSVALFKASPPGISVPDADLAAYRTGRGVRIGSTYESVVAVYGGSPEKRAGRFTIAYTAEVRDQSLQHKPVKLPETIKFAIDDDRVTAITIEIDEGGLF
jgi:hypothetical protein